jgi:hypothetical protein
LSTPDIATNCNTDFAKVWVVVDDFGDGEVAGGPFDSYADAAAYDTTDDRFEPCLISREEWDRVNTWFGVNAVNRQAEMSHDTHDAG